jgi:hypothetical protein
MSSADFSLVIVVGLLVVTIALFSYYRRHR